MSRRPFSWSGVYTEPIEEGLSELIVPKDATIDVAFIHGFTGHPVNTWTHKTALAKTDSIEYVAGSSERPTKTPRTSSVSNPSEGPVNLEKLYWPRDLLPQTLPTARILVYGYDTKIRSPFGKASANQRTVSDFALNFLQNLEKCRRSQPSRPLIIVAHSLGGLIAKESLRQARDCKSLQRPFHYRQLYDSTAGILFFGTPHSGADPLRWRKSIAENFARAFGISANKQVVNFLLPSSEQLRDLRYSFPSMIYDGGWIIYSFQESSGLTGLHGNKVVEDSSSCIGDYDLETIQSIAGDHMDMCKFKGFDDFEYQKVAAAFNHIQQHIVERSAKYLLPAPDTAHIASRAIRGLPQSRSSLEEHNFQKLRDSLRYSTTDARYYEIRNPHPGTCEWLLQTHEFRKWSCIDGIPGQNNFLCIKGKPGSGKSFLMKFATDNQQERTKNVVVSFFFKAGGEDLEKSVTGMYRSLLLQILESVPDLRLDTRGPRPDIFWKCEDYEWKIGELQKLFEIFIQALGQRRLMCFIDALDECKTEQRESLLSFLSNIVPNGVSSQGHFLVCLSSRYYPYESVENSFKMDLGKQDQHAIDITNYIDSSLKIGRGDRVERLKEYLFRKSSGVFLWVYLVVAILNKESKKGRMDSLEKRLNDIPDELENLFRDILTRNTEDRKSLVLCLQWVLYAARPLERKELYFGIKSGTKLEALSTPHLEPAPEDMDKFILDCSKGFVEITEHGRPRAQFIHESAREYFLGGNVFSDLKLELAPGLSHDHLGDCCEKYMQINNSQHLPDSLLAVASSESTVAQRDNISVQEPYLEYSVRHLLYHKNMADGFGVSQKAFVKNFDLAEWIKLNNAFQKFKTRRYSLTASLLYVLAEKNLSNLTRTHLREAGDSPKCSIVQLELQNYISPLHAALADSSCTESMLLALINPKKPAPYESQEPQIIRPDSGYERISTRIKKGLPRRDDLKNYPGRQLMHWAVIKKQAEVLDWLLSQAKVDPCCQDAKFLTPLHYAIWHEDERAIKSLLSSIVKLDPKRPTRSMWPAENEWEKTFDFFISRNIDLDLKISEGRTLLSHALLNGHECMVNALLSRKANPLIPDLYHRTPLSYAAGSGYEEVVKAILLRIDDLAFMEDVDSQYRNPLSYAAEGGHENVVRRLLGKGSDFDSEDCRGYTPIAYAAREGHDTVFDLLRISGADMISFTAWLKDEIETRLRDEKSLRSLLNYGSYLDGMTLDLSNALSNAVTTGCASMVDLMLSIGVDPDVLSFNSNHQTPLLIAIGKDNVDVADVLLSKGANPNAPGKDDKTPLMHACRRGRYDVVQLLLNKGADINLRDGNGWTALEFAVRNGRKDVGSLLESRGAVR